MKNQWLSRRETKLLLLDLIKVFRACRAQGIDPTKYNFNGMYRKYPRAKKLNIRRLWEKIQGE